MFACLLKETGLTISNYFRPTFELINTAPFYFFILQMTKYFLLNGLYTGFPISRL